MNPDNSAFAALLDQLAASRNPRDAAVADNYRFEERVGALRQQEYENGLSAPLAGLGDWLYRHDKQHMLSRIKSVGNDFIPDTFLPINEQAHLQDFAPNHDLVRVEDLNFAFAKSSEPLAFADIADLLAKRAQSAAAAKLLQFIDDWNLARANWPMFSAFYDEVKDDAEHADWPHRLRDRLGLEHYQGGAARAIPVALMRYPSKLVSDKLKRGRGPGTGPDARIHAAFALPTVLDGELNHAYFPTPAGHRYGATLNLAQPWQPVLSAEILNLRIDYQPAHLWKIGMIVRPTTTHLDLRARRDQHLTLLREESGNATFGQILADRP